MPEDISVQRYVHMHVCNSNFQNAGKTLKLRLLEHKGLCCLYALRLCTDHVGACRHEIAYEGSSLFFAKYNVDHVT